MVAILGLTLTPDEIALAIKAIQWAITEGSALFDALQIQQMTDLLAKLQAQAAQLSTDRLTANTDIDARDKQLEKDLGIAPVDVSKAFDTSDKPKP